MPEVTEYGTRSWKYRRRAAFISLASALLGLGYLIGWGEDTRLHQDIAGGLVTLAIWTVAIYVGGATADDALRDKYRKGQAHEPHHMAPHWRGVQPERDGFEGVSSPDRW